MKRSSLVGKYLDSLFPDPKCELNYSKDYELLIAIVLSAQSTDKRVNSVTSILFDTYKDLNSLMNADIKDLERIIYPVGSYHKKASYVKDIASILYSEYDLVVPRDFNELITFPGVGRKTANVFLAEFYNDPAIAVDTHVERVSKRLGLSHSSFDVLKVENSLMKAFPKKMWARRHLQLVLFGRYYCKAINPICSNCELSDICLYNKKQ